MDQTNGNSFTVSPRNRAGRWANKAHSQRAGSETLPDAQKQLLDPIKDDWLYPFIQLMMMTGLRTRELCALRWCDVNWERRTMHVVRTVVEFPSHRIEPKIRSARTVVLSDPAADMLRTLKNLQAKAQASAGSDWVETDLVFTRQNGTGLRPSSVSYSFALRVSQSPPITC